MSKGYFVPARMPDFAPERMPNFLVAAAEGPVGAAIPMPQHGPCVHCRAVTDELKYFKCIECNATFDTRCGIQADQKTTFTCPGCKHIMLRP